MHLSPISERLENEEGVEVCDGNAAIYLGTMRRMNTLQIEIFRMGPNFHGRDVKS